MAAPAVVAAGDVAEFAEVVLDFEEAVVSEAAGGPAAVPRKLAVASSFDVTFHGWEHNKWEVRCAARGGFDVLLCGPGGAVDDVRETHKIGPQHTAVVHKKGRGCSYRRDAEFEYVAFTGGFPNGGEPYADIHAPWGTHFNNAGAVPPEGMIVLRAPRPQGGEEGEEEEEVAGAGDDEEEPDANGGGADGFDVVLQDLEEGLPVDNVQHIDGFGVKWFNWTHNKWTVESEQDYEILFCGPKGLEDVRETHRIGKEHVAVVHKKGRGCTLRRAGGYSYVAFTGGFPNGGEPYADIHAPWGTHFNNAGAVPPAGMILLRAPHRSRQVKAAR